MSFIRPCDVALFMYYYKVTVSTKQQLQRVLHAVHIAPVLRGIRALLLCKIAYTQKNVGVNYTQNLLILILISLCQFLYLAFTESTQNFCGKGSIPENNC